LRPPHRFPRDAAQYGRYGPTSLSILILRCCCRYSTQAVGHPSSARTSSVPRPAFERGYTNLRRARSASSTGRTRCRRPLREYCEVRAHLMSSEPGAAFPAASHSRRSWAADSGKAEASRSSYRVATIRRDPTLPRSPLRSATRIDGGQGCYRQESVTLYKEGSTCRSWLRTSAENFR
jgi:hypothetical protein